jgi:TRAP-type C4-dicarboxylate transport system permease small subunit
MSFSNSFKTLGSFYERLEEILLVSLVVLMVSLGFLQILFRNLISVGIVWIDSLVRHMVLWIALLGASVATRENRHITIDIISGRVPPAYYSWIQGAIQLFSALVCLLLVSPPSGLCKMTMWPEKPWPSEFPSGFPRRSCRR